MTVQKKSKKSDGNVDLETFLKTTRGNRGGRSCLFCKDDHLAADVRRAVEAIDNRETKADLEQVYVFLARKYDLKSRPGALRYHVRKHVRGA